ncbi:MAG: D-glycero-alpha-D-manno-heptose-1,7-bisphosphate 7-phosphatase [Steroidobacterales bacterium]
MNDKVVILDRDGTMVIDCAYLDDPAGLEFLPSAAEGLRWLSSRGYRVVVITNQSGVGRGLFPIERVYAMEAGARLEYIYFCPHAPDAGCDCRKPALRLMTRAAAELGFDPASAIVIGDKESDVEFGRRAGAVTFRHALSACGRACRSTTRLLPR